MLSELSLARDADARDIAVRCIAIVVFVLLAGLSFGALVAAARAGARTELVADLCLFALFLLEAAFVLLRPMPVARAAGIAPRIAALAGTWLMALMVLLPPPVAPAPALARAGSLLGLAGAALAVASVMSLGRSFSVMAEARRLVTAGPYRIMRHPLYVAEEIAIGGVVISHFSGFAAALFALQAGCQVWRARNEERVLGGAFPDFARYRRTTPALLFRLDPAALWIAVFAYALMVALGARLLADPDSFLHVAVGQWIWAHAAVPTVDPFSLTRLGAPWVAHEWLAGLMFAGAYAACGWAGVTTLAAAAAAGAFAVLAASLRRSLPLRGVAVVLSLSFLLLAPHLSARPHVLVLPLTAGWVAGLVEARRAGRAPSLALLPLAALWANLHGSFPLAPAFAAAFAIEAVLAARDPAARRAVAVAWAGFCAAAATATLLTPLGFAAWRLPFALMQMDYARDLVGEWQAANFARFQPVEVWLLGLMGLALAGRLRLGMVRLVLLLGLFHLALAHARFGDLLALLGPLLIADGLAPLFAPARAPTHGRLHPALALAALAAITVLGAMRPIANTDPRIAPVRALAALPPGPVFNDYDFGDFLIFSGVPPLVDGRLDLYGDAFMRDYMAALEAKGDALPDLIDSYRVRAALLKPERPAAALLARMPGWRRIYADRDAVVYVNDRRP